MANFLGFADSSVYFYEGNLFKDRPVLKFKALHETGQNSNSVTTEDGAVVGITVTTSVRNNAEVVVVFVVTVASVRSYVIEAGAMTQKVLILLKITVNIHKFYRNLLKEC